MDNKAENSFFIKQLELYSNSIIGFIVIQGLAYCYKFGSDKVFSEAVKKTLELSVGLVFALTCTMILALIANYLIGKKTSTMVKEENVDLVKKIYKGKLIAILFFGLLPIAVTFYFAIIEGRVE